MSTSLALPVRSVPPVLKHRDWRFLQREFVNAHPSLRPHSLVLVRNCLAPAAALAWYLLTVRPWLLEVNCLKVLVPGSGLQEAADSGRWFSFLPWLVGRPNLSVDVTLVGYELSATPDGHSQDSRGFSPEELHRQLQTGAASSLRNRPAARIVNGLLSDWAKDSPAMPQVCALFSPDFEVHYASWLAQDELLPLLRAGVAIPAFAYSELDYLGDCHTLEACGLTLSPANPVARKNPWAVTHEDSSFEGAYAQFCWDVAVQVPTEITFDEDKIRELVLAQRYVKDQPGDCGDQALRRIGVKVKVGELVDGVSDGAASGKGPEGLADDEDDYIFMLPDNMAVVQSDGEAGIRLNDCELECFEPSVYVPAHVLAEWPEDNRIAQLLWAVKVHRDYIVPFLPLSGYSHVFPDETLTLTLKIALSQLDKAKRPSRGTRRAQLGTGAFFNALDHQNYPRAARLAQETPSLLQASDEQGKTALMRVNKPGLEDLFLLWLKQGALLNTLDEAGQGLVHDVVQANNTETLLLLMEHGADIGLRNYLNFTPASICLTNASWNCLEILVESGADISTLTLRSLSVAKDWHKFPLPEKLSMSIRERLAKES